MSSFRPLQKGLVNGRKGFSLGNPFCGPRSWPAKGTNALAGLTGGKTLSSFVRWAAAPFSILAKRTGYFLLSPGSGDFFRCRVCGAGGGTRPCKPGRREPPGQAGLKRFPPIPFLKNPPAPAPAARESDGGRACHCPRGREAAPHRSFGPAGP